MKDITHKGVVLEVSDEVVHVKIVSQSACSGCHAKSACGASDTAEKIIDVKTNDYRDYKEGDSVEVSITQKSSIIVTILAYIVPTILVLALIIGFNINEVSDAVAGIVALAFVFIYFVVLFMFKKHLNKKVAISIRPI
ncbi:MAG: SoxR reducing system RseC family protein [Rikenellaceae bacterium]